MTVNSSFFWKLFEKTGSIKFYLAYKHFFSDNKIEKNKNY